MHSHYLSLLSEVGNIFKGCNPSSGFCVDGTWSAMGRKDFYLDSLVAGGILRVGEYFHARGLQRLTTSFNPWSLGGSFMVQKMAVSSHSPVF